MWQRLKSTFRGQWPTAVGLFITLVALGFQMFAFNAPGSLPARVLDRIDTLIYDWRLSSFIPHRPEATPILIVDIDEGSLKREGQWPWPRDKDAQLIKALEDDGAALIGFDIVFSEPEQNPVSVILNDPKLSPDVRRSLDTLAPSYDGDSHFAGSLQKNVVMGYMLHNTTGIAVGTLPQPLLEVDKADSDSLAVTIMPDFTSNLPQLMKNGQPAGFFSTTPDDDGVIRRSPLIMRRNDSIYSALSVEMARVYLHAGVVQMHTGHHGNQTRVEGIQVGDRLLNCDEAGLALVPYKGGAKSYKYIPATDVLHGNVPADTFKGAIVLVGTSALGLSDLRTTPLQTGYPGVEVHANLLDSILQSDGHHKFSYFRPDWEPGATSTLLLISCLVLAFWLPRLSPPLMLLVASTWLALLVLSNCVLWKNAHYDLPVAILLMPAVIIALFNIVFGFLRANSQKREIQSMFGQYVPPEHVARMLENPDTVSLEGEQREMTVLFSDIRSFTTISEGLTAAELKNMLNRFFTPITQIIFDNNGTIDKYVGDMVMAFWNAPLNDERHASNAIAAALAMLAKIEELKPQFAAMNLPEVNVGIGINTGTMNVGDMGSSYRRAYTVLGDAVNLGSRLEGATKMFGVKLLVGELTQTLAPEYLYRQVGRVRVKGKHEPVNVFEPVCLQEDASESRRARVDKFNEAVHLHFAQQWKQADLLLRELLAQDPERKLYQIMRERIAELRMANLAPDWDGVYELQTK
jgi:adenylate cyclase